MVVEAHVDQEPVEDVREEQRHGSQLDEELEVADEVVEQGAAFHAAAAAAQLRADAAQVAADAALAAAMATLGVVDPALSFEAFHDLMINVFNMTE
jgi:hypothetical protein